MAKLKSCRRNRGSSSHSHAKKREKGASPALGLNGNGRGASGTVSDKIAGVIAVREGLNGTSRPTTETENYTPLPPSANPSPPTFRTTWASVFSPLHSSRSCRWSSFAIGKYRIR